MAALEFQPTRAALGAEIRCGDLRSANDATTKAIHEVWLERQGLLFRGTKPYFQEEL